MASHVLQSLQRHETYYIPSADLSILVQHVQFRVHRYFFERESLYFKTQLKTPTSPGAKPQGSSDSNSFILEDVTPSEFSRFCWVFYNPRYSIYDDASVDDWQSILLLAHKWMFAEVKSLALRELEKRPHEMTPVKRIKLYHETEVDRNLLISRYAALCEREQPLTYEEGCDLGMETTLMIAKGREEIRANRTPSGMRSPLTPTISGEDVRIFVRDLFKIDSPNSPDEEASSATMFSHISPPAARGMTPTPSRTRPHSIPKPKPQGTPTKQPVVVTTSNPTYAPTPLTPMNGQTSGGLPSSSTQTPNGLTTEKPASTQTQTQEEKKSETSSTTTQTKLPPPPSPQGPPPPTTPTAAQLKLKEKAEKAERKKARQAEKERLEREEKEQSEKKEQERLAKEEKERSEREEKERLAREEKERLDKEEKARLERERLDKEEKERERLDKEEKEKERLAKEKERLEEEEKEKLRVEKERVEKERLEKEQLEEKERLEKARLEEARQAKEKVEEAKREEERLELERLEKEKVEKEKEKTIEAEKLAQQSQPEPPQPPSLTISTTPSSTQPPTKKKKKKSKSSRTSEAQTPVGPEPKESLPTSTTTSDPRPPQPVEEARRIDEGEVASEKVEEGVKGAVVEGAGEPKVGEKEKEGEEEEKDVKEPVVAAADVVAQEEKLSEPVQNVESAGSDEKEGNVNAVVLETTGNAETDTKTGATDDIPETTTEPVIEAQVENPSTSEAVKDEEKVEPVPETQPTNEADGSVVIPTTDATDLLQLGSSDPNPSSNEKEDKDKPLEGDTLSVPPPPSDGQTQNLFDFSAWEDPAPAPAPAVPSPQPTPTPEVTSTTSPSNKHRMAAIDTNQPPMSPITPREKASSSAWPRSPSTRQVAWGNKPQPSPASAATKAKSWFSSLLGEDDDEEKNKRSSGPAWSFGNSNNV